MTYDIIGNSFGYSSQDDEFFTIGDLIDVCEKHPDKVVRFLSTEYSPGDLGSWRGSYDLPAIVPTSEARTGKMVADSLRSALTEDHCGYKGGKYRYHKADEFYVSHYGISQEYKVVKAEVQGDELILYTKLDPY